MVDACLTSNMLPVCENIAFPWCRMTNVLMGLNITYRYSNDCESHTDHGSNKSTNTARKREATVSL